MLIPLGAAIPPTIGSLYAALLSVGLLSFSKPAQKHR
jgi:hypothetical protein